jgi:CubicO group peptidase (beta-lactamase class C family)
MMRTILNLSSLILLLTALIVHAQSPNQSHGSLEPNEIFNKFRVSNSHAVYDSTSLDSFIIAKMDQYHFPGLQACIVKNDQIIWKGNYGYANIEQTKLVTDSTLFYIASVSKTVTATALMQLWEQNLFNLDDDVNDYLPFPVRNPNHPNVPITFRMLLTHTSGILENDNVLNSSLSWGIDSPLPLDSFIVNYLIPGGSYYSPSNFSSWVPGSQWAYNTTGVALMGYLVERIRANSFEKYCQDSILVPLGMNETSWFLANLDKNNIAIPYRYSEGSYQPYSHYGTPVYPGAQLRTSAIQLSRFLSAFIQMGQIDGIRILDSITVALMTTSHFPTPDSQQGFIWFVPEIYVPNIGTRIGCGHIGIWYGANAFIGYILETGENVGAIVLTNGRSENGIWEIELELISYGILNTVNAIEEDKQLPIHYTLGQNYPNPFNPSTTIEFTLPKSEFIELKVFNILGKEVSTLVSKKLYQGNHTYKFDGSDLASGVYYYQLVAGDNREVKKMILLR